MITYVKGDLFAANERAVAHGCNCHGVMGAGVAAIVRDRFPVAYNRYKMACDITKDFYPGVAQPVSCDVPNWDTGGTDVTTVYNLATQNAPGANAKYDYVEGALRNMRRHMLHVGNSRIAMPKIGAGIGGLEWEMVEQVINSVFGSEAFMVVVYEL